MHLAARQGDTETAQRLLREAAATYFACTPAAPVATVAPRHRVRRAARTTVYR